MTLDLRNDPDWKTKAPYGLHVDGSPLTQQEYEALKSGKKAHIELSVDSKQLRDSLQDNIEKDQQIKDLEEKLNLVAQNAWEKKKREVGCNDPTVNDPDSLMAWEKGRNSVNGQPMKPINAGVVPLSSQTQTSQPQAFESQEELIDSIRDRCSASNPDKQDRENAKLILDKLFEKSLKGQKDANKPFSYEMEKETSISEMLNQKYRRRKQLKGETR